MLRLEVLGLSSDGSIANMVLLRHEDRFLPILVGPAEGDAILNALIHRDIGRPMTHDLICNILAGLRGVLQSIVIYKLERDTFYAHLNIEQRSPDGQVEQVIRVDSRPSDGIAIAVRVDAPIYTTEEVMDRAGKDMSYLENVEGVDEDEDDEDSGESDFEE
jgi:hypothetical protein